MTKTTKPLTSPLDPHYVKVNFTANIPTPSGRQEKKTFTQVFLLEGLAVTMPWYVLRNHILPTFLKTNLGPEGVAWTNIYEFVIIKMINKNNPQDFSQIPLRVMTRPQLQAFSKAWDLNVPIDELPTDDLARELIQLKQDDPSGYEVRLASIREDKKRDYPELDALRQKSRSGTFEDHSKDFEALESAPSPTPAMPTPAERLGKKIPKQKSPKSPEEIEPVEPQPSDPFDGL